MPRTASLSAYAFDALRSVGEASTRPRIGVALGGGAARGWAHIGVLRELVSAGFPPDVVVGTSIGAVVGACYVAGKLDALEGFARGLNRRRVFGLMDVSFAGTSLIGGARLRRRLDRDLGGLRLEGLPIPFAAVATELGSGREVCLRTGNLIEAVRASYALPGIFEPMMISGRWLFDGAMSNPVPVSTCRMLGADIVLAISLTTDPEDGDAPIDSDVTRDPSVTELDGLATTVAVESAEPRRRRLIRRRRLSVRRRFFARQSNGAPGIASVMVGAFSIAQERISRSRLAIDPPDVLINARMAKIGLFDFHKANELIDYGAGAARMVLKDIEERLYAAKRGQRAGT